jgi:hypothetical protein
MMAMIALLFPGAGSALFPGAGSAAEPDGCKGVVNVQTTLAIISHDETSKTNSGLLHLTGKFHLTNRSREKVVISGKKTKAGFVLHVREAIPQVNISDRWLDARVFVGSWEGAHDRLSIEPGASADVIADLSHDKKYRNRSLEFRLVIYMLTHPKSACIVSEPFLIQ